MALPRSRVRTTQWNLFFHYVSIALMMVSGVVLVPFYLRYIPLGLYGAWLATGNILVWLTIIDPGLSAVLQQRVGVAYGEKDFIAIRELMAAGLAVSSGMVLAVLLFGLVTVDLVPGWIMLSDPAEAAELKVAFSFALVGTALSLFSFSVTAVNQGLQSSVAIGLVYVASTLSGIIVTVVLLLGGQGLLSIPVGALVRAAGLTLGNLAYLAWRSARERIGFTLRLTRLRELLGLVTFTFMGRASGVLIRNIDLFVASRFLGPEAVPLLHLTRRAPDLCRTFVERPATAFMPAVSHLIGEGDLDKARKILTRLLRIIIWTVALLTGGFIALNDDFVRLWVGAELYAGGAVNYATIATFAVSVVASSLGTLCFALGNIKGNSVAALIQALLYVPAVIIGARLHGMLGVVIAQLVTTLLVTGWYFPWRFARLLSIRGAQLGALAGEVAKSLVIAAPLTVVSALVAPAGWLGFAAVVTSFAALYVVGMWLTSRDMRGELVGALRKSSLVQSR